MPKRETPMRKQWKWPVFGWRWVSAVLRAAFRLARRPCTSKQRDCFVDLKSLPVPAGEGSGSKALQGPRTSVWGSAQRLHEDGTSPQQAEPWQSQNGSAGVQREPVPAPVSCEERERAQPHQPAAQRLPRGQLPSVSCQGEMKPWWCQTSSWWLLNQEWFADCSMMSPTVFKGLSWCNMCS